MHNRIGIIRDKLMKNYILLSSTLVLIAFSSCSSVKKLYTTADEPLKKDSFEWEQASSPSGCKFRARDAEIKGVVDNQSWIRVEIENAGKTPVAVDPMKVILRSPLLKDSITPVTPEKIIASAKAKIDGTDKMMNEATWEGVKEIDDAMGKDKNSDEVHQATKSQNERVRERESAAKEQKRLQELIPMIEAQSLKTSTLEPGATVSGLLIYDTEFKRKGTASLDYTGDPCKSSLNFSVKP